MKNLIAGLVLGLSGVTGSAGAAGGPRSSSHHCVKDGAEISGVSKKECKKQSGKWEKIGLTPTAVPVDAAAPGATAPPANKSP